LRAKSGVAAQLLRGRLAVYLGRLLLADVPLNIHVGAGRAESAAKEAMPVSAAYESARRYRRIFASYSHKDSGIVEEFERYARVLGDQYLRDVTTLRAGEDWNKRLKDLIEEADVFQLFWSWRSIDSVYVRQEWEHALRLGRPGFIRPVYWEEPIPRRPESDLPPAALSQLHFQKLPPGFPVNRVNMVPPALAAAEAVVPPAYSDGGGSAITGKAHIFETVEDLRQRSQNAYSRHDRAARELGPASSHRLIIYEGGDQAVIVELRSTGPNGLEWRVGSDEGREIRISKDGISGLHAKIILGSDKAWKVVDQLSTYGTFLNGRRVNTSSLRSGDRIVFGTVECVFQEPGENREVPSAGSMEARRKPYIKIVLWLFLIALVVLFIEWLR